MAKYTCKQIIEQTRNDISRLGRDRIIKLIEDGTTFDEIADTKK